MRGMARKISGMLETEDTPGADCEGADRLKEFVRRHAWGHHASCTCPIGPKDAGGVLTSDFRRARRLEPQGRRRERVP